MYPKRFLIWVNQIIDQIEGGYVNHPNDPGGETRYGITKRVAMSHGYNGSMRDLPRDKAIDIYYQDYWKGKLQENLANEIGLCVFDASINSGQHKAIQLLQRAVGVKDDGIAGVETMNAISNMSESEIVKRYNEERIKFYRSLPTYSTFGRGWENRIRILNGEKFKVDRSDYID